MNTPIMNKEEMIETLKGLVFRTFDKTTAKEREAFDMAISALEKQTDTIKGLDGILYVQDNDKQGFTPQTDSVLEDIKAEIENKINIYKEIKDWGRYYGLSVARDIVDNHISGKE